MSKKVLKKNVITTINRSQFHLKMVTSDICEICKSQCNRGITYMDYMKIPGSVGRGVPCILTKGKK
jgi:hypothetical protein